MARRKGEESAPQIHRAHTETVQALGHCLTRDPGGHPGWQQHIYCAYDLVSQGPCAKPDGQAAVGPGQRKTPGGAAKPHESLGVSPGRA